MSQLSSAAARAAATWPPTVFSAGFVWPKLATVAPTMTAQTDAVHVRMV
jgi:hypothetical protein